MRYEFWIDRGGTFTDCILRDHKTDKVCTVKVLSSDDAPIEGIRTLLELGPNEPIPPSDIRLGTTVATNALLERKGAETGLLITKGFADLLEIGDQTRPELFSLKIPPRQNLYSAVREIDARLDAQGHIVHPGSASELTDRADELSNEGVKSIALVVMHAYANPEFERDLRCQLERHFTNVGVSCTVTASTDLSGEQGFLARASTAVLDAYVGPLLKDYLSHLKTHLPGSRLRMMQSQGGLATPEFFRGPASLLSGPAGGVVAAEHIAKALGSKTLVTFDMGGTSTDVALIRERAERRYETTIDGIPVLAPMVDLHTVAAGGGSVCAFDGYRLRVGPESVGAIPGPLCYGRERINEVEERLAVTDINAVLGRLTADHFQFPLKIERSREALARLALRLKTETGQAYGLEELALSFIRIANTNMAEALRTVTVGRGINPTDADLLVFGGAAGQHACGIARRLGMRRILVHRHAGVLSAYGIGRAPEIASLERDAGRLELGTLECEKQINRLIEEMTREGLTHLERDPLQSRAPQKIAKVDLRYRGTNTAISLPWTSSDEARELFEDEHERRFGFRRQTALIEAVTARLDLSLASSATDTIQSEPSRLMAQLPSPLRYDRVCLESRIEERTPVYELRSLEGCTALEGPALLLDPTGTYLVDDDFSAKLIGEILTLSRRSVKPAPEPVPKATSTLSVDDVSVAATRFAKIAEQMGQALRRSASSTNIRDRLDFSCAIFDPDGRLIANAPHIPVHLGAMSESVRAVLLRHPTLRPGDAFATNDPTMGGSHLPDVTVISPVFDTHGELIALTASRGHHADVGGTSPGSMPAFSRSLSEEGFVFSATPLLRDGLLLEADVMALMLRGDYPARNPSENLADLRAQLAANQLGARLLIEMSEEANSPKLLSQMTAVRELSSRWMRDTIRALPDGVRHFEDELDDGTRIAVQVEVVSDQVHIDFTGTSTEHASNFNAPQAVTLACVLYVMRTLLGRPLPLNEGCLEPVTLRIPKNSLLSPGPLAAVAAGNVETSQRIVDVLLGALDLAAASQGTMNNLSFGNGSFGYYETIAGGAGAGPGFDGASAVHSHMTNTRITDPEILEDRFPVRLLEFAIRRNSAGAGRWHGGDGVRRSLEALAPIDYSILSSRRTIPPFGLSGAEPGRPGRNSLNGQELPGRVRGKLQGGDQLCIETPGAGGYGSPSRDQTPGAQQS